MNLAELRAIDEARTPGPWEAEGCGIWLGIRRDTPDGFDFEGRIYDEGGHTEADAAAIAAHANAFPFLLAIAEAAAALADADIVVAKADWPLSQALRAAPAIPGREPMTSTARPATARRNVPRHDCVCPDQPLCVLHGAQEWGGGEPDECQRHGHGLLLDVDRLARAMTGFVFMDTASNRPVASAIAKRYSEEVR